MRRLVLLSGAVLSLAGLGFVPLLPVAAGLKALLALLWLALCSHEWYAQWQGYARSGGLRIAAGGHVERQCHAGTWQPARLRAGSLVLSRLAWLRVESRDRRSYAELVCGDCRESEEWRRLQVIWRHVGAV